MDASLQGWGACLTEPVAPPPPPAPVLARGFWTAPERLQHINVLELEAVLHAVRTFWTCLSGRQVQLAMDSQVVFHLLRSMCSPVDPLYC